MWQVAWASVGTKELVDYLKNGWEPFAVSPAPEGKLYDPNFMVIWLKKVDNA